MKFFKLNKVTPESDESVGNIAEGGCHNAVFQEPDGEDRQRQERTDQSRLSTSFPLQTKNKDEEQTRRSKGTGSMRTQNISGDRLSLSSSQYHLSSSVALNMSGFHGKVKSKNLTWTLVLLAVSIASLWLCAILYFVTTTTNNESHPGGVSTWGCSDLPIGYGAGDPALSSNLRPIIGVLSQEYKYNWDPKDPPPTKSYIAASYVKFLEGAGARVVPIKIDESEEYYRKIFDSVNGLLFPGGAVPFDESKFGKVGRLLYQLAIEANDKKDYFPVWGTCLGFEFMLYAAAGNQEIRALCGANNVTNRLKFTDAASTSRLFGSARRSVINTLGTKEVTVNFHHFCITPENFTKFHIDEKYRILSMNYDRKADLQYISAVEAKDYPFYAVQFHPEKIIYEWTLKENLPHSSEATEAAQYFANFFVNEARKNHHKFSNEQEENDFLIYNYPPTFTGYSNGVEEGSTFEQMYFFPLNSSN